VNSGLWLSDIWQLKNVGEIERRIFEEKMAPGSLLKSDTKEAQISA